MICFDAIKNLAFVGLSPNPQKPSHQVAQYMQSKGYKIFPVYPKPLVILGESTFQHIGELKNAPIDWVVVFRKSEACLQITQEILNLHSPSIQGIWLQVGITNQAAQELAHQHKLQFVQNQCIKIQRQLYEN